MEDVLFDEKQRFGQWWLVLILIIPFAVVTYKTGAQLFFDEVLGDKPMSNVGLVLFNFFYLIFLLVFYRIRMVTQITKDGISVDFRPFVSPCFYKWDEISKVSLVEFAPLKDHWGWGVRNGKDGEAFTVKGNKALKIVFINNRTLLIGTQLSDTIHKVLKGLAKI